MGWGMSWLQHTTPMTHGIIIIRLDLCSPKINHNIHVFREMELTVLRAMTWVVWLSISVLHFCTLTHVHVQMLPITYEFSIPSHFCLSINASVNVKPEGGPGAYVGHLPNAPHMPYVIKSDLRVHKVNSATELRDMHKCTNSYLTWKSFYFNWMQIFCCFFFSFSVVHTCSIMFHQLSRLLQPGYLFLLCQHCFERHSAILELYQERLLKRPHILKKL